MSLPEKKIKKVTLPGDVSGSQTYEIIPERLGKNGHEAALPSLDADKTIAVEGISDKKANVFFISADEWVVKNGTTKAFKDVYPLTEEESDFISYSATSIRIDRDSEDPNIVEYFLSWSSENAGEHHFVHPQYEGSNAYIDYIILDTLSYSEASHHWVDWRDEEFDEDAAVPCLVINKNGRANLALVDKSNTFTEKNIFQNDVVFHADSRDEAINIYGADGYIPLVKLADGEYQREALRVINLALPESDDEAANKKYVDSKITKYFDKFVTGADIDEQMSMGQIAYCDQGSVVVGGEVPSTVIIKFTQAAKRAIYLKKIYIRYVDTDGDELEYEYEFTVKQFTSVGQTVTLNGIEWQVQDPNTSLYFGYSGSYGQQFGSGSQAASELTLTTVDFAGCTIKEVIITACGASSTNARLLISAGNDQWLYHEGESDESTYKVLSPNTAEDPATFTYGEGSTPGAGVIVNYVETFVKRVNTEALVEAINPVENVLYVETTNNKIYRFNGTTLIEVSKSLELGGTNTTAYRGDLGTDNRNRIFDILNNQLPAKASIEDINAKVLSYSATMDILTSVIIPEGVEVENNNATFPEGVTVSNHNINL